MRPNYFIFIGYLKTGGGIRADPPPIIPHLDPSMFYNRFHFQPLLIIWTVGKKTYLHRFGNKKNVADQPAYSCSLISGFVIKSTLATSNILLF